MSARKPCDLSSGVKACGFTFLTKPLREKHSKGYDAKVVAVDKDGNEILVQVIDSCVADNYIKEIVELCGKSLVHGDKIGISRRYRDPSTNRIEWYFDTYTFRHAKADEINHIASQKEGKTIMGDPKMAWASKDSGMISSSRMPNVVYRPVYPDEFFDTEVGKFKMSMDRFGTYHLVNERGFISNGNEFSEFVLPVRAKF